MEWYFVRPYFYWDCKTGRTLITDGEFWTAFGHNVIVMVFSIVLQIPIGMSAGNISWTQAGRRPTCSRVVWFFPYLMSSVAIAFLFTYALATNGGMVSALATIFTGQKVPLWTCWEAIPRHCIR